MNNWILDEFINQRWVLSLDDNLFVDEKSFINDNLYLDEFWLMDEF